MSKSDDPRLAGINAALTEIEPLLEEVGGANGFTLTRARQCYRYLQRDLHAPGPFQLYHEIGLIISLPRSECLQQGFFPEIPCTLYIFADDRVAGRHYHAEIVKDQPFNSLKASLAGHLREAVARLDRCTADFIAEHGTPNIDRTD